MSAAETKPVDPVLTYCGFKSKDHVAAACIWNRDFVETLLAEKLMERIRETPPGTGELFLMVRMLPESAQRAAEKYIKTVHDGYELPKVNL